MYGKLLERSRKLVEHRLDEKLKAQRHAVDRIVQRYRDIGAVLLDPGVGDTELRPRLLAVVSENELLEDQTDLVRWTRGDRRARFEETAERHNGMSRFRARLSAAFDRFLEDVPRNRQVSFDDDGWRLKTDRAEQLDPEQLHYPTFRAMGLCIATGVVEAGCRNIVGARLKRSGMHWTVDGANAIIALRCSILSNRFDDFSERLRRLLRTQNSRGIMTLSQI